MQQFTVNNQTFNLVAMPTTPGPVQIELAFNDSSADVESPFTKQLQVQNWPGADWWEVTITLPSMTPQQSWPWEAFLAELRGKQNVFQIGDPRASSPQGNVYGSAPVVNGSNTAMGTTLATSGWKANSARLLLSGDYIQLGYRLHRVCETVSSDGSGNATLSIWPSLREVPTNGSAIIVRNTQGLFRLASNRRTIQHSINRLTTLSFQAVEVR